MTTALPCGCPVDGSLFDTADGRRVLLINPRVDWIDPSVWCADELKWVRLDDAQHDELWKVGR